MIFVRKSDGFEIPHGAPDGNLNEFRLPLGGTAAVGFHQGVLECSVPAPNLVGVGEDMLHLLQDIVRKRCNNTVELDYVLRDGRVGVPECDSTWINHSSGLVIQKVGNFKVEGYPCEWTGSDPAAALVPDPLATRVVEPDLVLAWLSGLDMMCSNTGSPVLSLT